MASGKRMFRVAVSYTVAVEAETDSQALSNAPFVPAYDSSVRKLSIAVLESWQVPGVSTGKSIEVEAPAVPYEETPDSDSGLPPKASVYDDGIPF